MRIFRLAALTAAASISLIAGQATGQNRTAIRNSMVTMTPAGGHLLGNPAAKARLVGYVSYTCGHCAQFDREAMDSLRIFLIGRGKLSFEVRNLVRDQIDMTAALLVQCGAPSRFFANHTMFMRSQNRWLARANSATEGQKKRWSTGNPATRMRAIAQDFGFYPMMEARGYGRPEIDRCLANVALGRKLAEQSDAAGKLGVTGTPSFLLNDELLAGTHDWQTLQAQLNARL